MSALAIYGAYCISELTGQAEVARALGQYVLRECLGEGGMGSVYVAEHRLLKRPCAVKFIRAEHAGNDLAIKRFEREVNAVAGLTHPNTVQIYDYGQIRRRHALLRHGAAAGHDARRARRAARPDGAAARRPCARPALRRAERSARSGTGAPRPETGEHHAVRARWHLRRGQAARLRSRRRADDAGRREDHARRAGGRHAGVHVAGAMHGRHHDRDGERHLQPGAVAHFLLTGEPPFPRRNAMQTLYAHIHETPPRADWLRPDIPPTLSDAIERCLSKAPDERFRTVTELEAALRTAVGIPWTADDAKRWWRAREPAIAPPLPRATLPKAPA